MAMELTLFLVLAAILVAGFAGLFFMLRKGKDKKEDNDGDQALSMLQKQINEFMRTFDQRLGESSRLMQDQLNSRMRENQESMHNVNQQFQSFVKGVTELTESVRQVQGSVKDISSFQEILRTPKLRGRWGELSLEHILAEYFPRDSYELQHQFSSGEQVDALLRLPNGKFLPIDAKFPLDDFVRMHEASGDAERNSFAKSFAATARKEIDDIAKKYLVPGEDTTEFALMYVPAEAVYYEMAHRLADEDLPSYARGRRVVIVSPNTLFLMIQMIQHWARDVQVGRQTQEILKRLGRITTDAQKLSDGFDKIGKHLRDATNAHGDAEGRLRLLVDRVGRIAELEEEPQKRLSGEEVST